MRLSAQPQTSPAGPQSSPKASSPAPSGPSGKPSPKQKAQLRRGDLVFSPYTYGSNLIFQVVQAGPQLTFIVGEQFTEPTPVLTADLRPLQNKLIAEPSSAIPALRAHVLRTARKATANDVGMLRLQMLKEGLERLSPLIEGAVGVAAGAVTYAALKGIIDAVLKDRTSSREERPDYAYESSLFFDYK